MQIEARLGVEALAAVIMEFYNNGIEEYDSLVAELKRNDYRSKPKKLELYMKHRESPPVKPSIEETPKLDLKALPPYLSYIFLGRDNTLPVKIVAVLNDQQVECLVIVLRRYK